MILRIKFTVLNFVTISEQAGPRVLPSEFATRHLNSSIPSAVAPGSDSGTLFAFRNNDY